jgi:hypothetical protein
MNITPSLVQSYMYADMFNREYDGGAERVIVGGVPVEHILPSLRKQIGANVNVQEGGNTNSYSHTRNCPHNECGDGPFKNKVVPAGLVVIGVHKDPDSKYEDYFHPTASREVISDSMYDMLFASVLEPKNALSFEDKSSLVTSPFGSPRTPTLVAPLIRSGVLAKSPKRRTPPKIHPLKQNRSRKQKK